MKDSNLPEEKLLRLIRKGKKEETAPAKKTATEEIPARKARAAAYKPDLAFLRLASIVVFASSCLFLLKALFAAPVAIPAPVEPEKDVAVAGEASRAQTLDYYLQAASSSRVFGLQQDESKNEQGAEVSESQMADILKDLNLLGVVSGAQPQAIIEDKRAQKTYYLNTGQSLGDLRVEAIQENKVILDYKGRRSELYF